MQAITENNSVCKGRNLFACTELSSGQSVAAMTDWKKLTVSERLTVLRKTHGLKQDTFAVEIGVDPDTDTYGKAERTGNIAQLAPRILARFTEIDAGWLFQGLTGNISQTTEKRLDEAYSGLAPIARRKRNQR